MFVKGIVDMIKKLELKNLQYYPMNEDAGITVQTCTRVASGEGRPMGYKTGRLIGVSARTECEILFDKDDFAEKYDLNQIKPILRPWSDIGKEIEVNGKKFTPITALLQESNFDTDKMSMDEQLEYIGVYEIPAIVNIGDARLLALWGFDFENLIGAGLAIDINTL